MLKGDGFLVAGATLGADLNLVVQILFYITIWVGVVAQLRQRHKLHDWLLTTVVVLNLFFIVFIMVSSLIDNEVVSTLPERPSDPFFLSAGIHAVLGVAAQGSAIYSLLAGHKILPRKIGVLRYWMWATLALWTVSVLLGAGTYYYWYVRDTPTEVAELRPENVGDDAAPLVQQVLMGSFEFLPREITVVAGTTVVWLNQDGAPHNVTYDDDSLASGNFFQGDTYSITFDAPGTYPVYCSLHGGPGGRGMAMVVHVLEASEENLAAQAARPTPVSIASAPIPAPAVEPPPLALFETPPSPEDLLVGLAAFSDAHHPSDSVTLILEGIEPPPTGAALHGWLSSSRDGSLLDIGRFEPDGDGNVIHTYSDADGRNLSVLFDGVEITQESGTDDVATRGPALYSGRQSTQALESIRQLTAGVDTPDNPGFATAARLQAIELSRHTALTEPPEEYDEESILDARRHAEHVINVLEGLGGEFFGDLDGQWGIQNPGDGHGLIKYIEDVKRAAGQAREASDASNAIRVHAGSVEQAADNALRWALTIREAGLQIIESPDVESAAPHVNMIVEYSRLLLFGEDSDSDGEVSPSEGGIHTMYQYAQYMAAVPIAAGPGPSPASPPTDTPLPTAVGATPEPTDTSAPSLTEAAPRPTNTPLPSPTADAPGATETPSPPPLPPEIIVYMDDFTYSELTLRIPVGTTVTWINRGEALHSATADDGSFDTGLYGTGEQASITFDTPGAYPYYCTLHGAPGGLGMAATIIVEPQD